ncbi:MAG: hypothetical protein ER33_05250 [Cyanobium sp. CACIAM 14]|nr:MAG: hypothetical protein ER33_05250 [Cyanobium sp. CACIAM 14]
MGRVVIVDPAFASSAGHHVDVNDQLLEVLSQQGWAVQCWCDEAVTRGGCIGVFSGCGYVDPRHWADLGGTVHLAKRMERQFLKALGRPAGEPPQPVIGWVLHTALPFQLLGLARALRHQPRAVVVVSLMFSPGETLEGEGGVPSAVANCRMALSALARAVKQGGHRLHLQFPSQQGQELYTPVLKAAGLSSSGLHPAVVGTERRIATHSVAPPQCSNNRARILLHWGDTKVGKGRQEALEVVTRLLNGGPLPPPLDSAEWLFQLHSEAPLPESERVLLDRGRQQVKGFLWLNERVGLVRMQELLAGCDVALLAYDPNLYRYRSSGLLWSYASARWHSRRSAAIVGRSGGWLEREARDLGLTWWSGADGSWLESLASAVIQSRAEASRGADQYTDYGRWMLGNGFATHVAELIKNSEPT